MVKILLISTTDIKELNKFNDIDILLIKTDFIKDINFKILNTYIRQNMKIKILVNKIEIKDRLRDDYSIQTALTLNPQNFTSKEYKIYSALKLYDVTYNIYDVNFDEMTIYAYSDNMIKEKYSLNELDRKIREITWIDNDEDVIREILQRKLKEHVESKEKQKDENETFEQK